MLFNQILSRKGKQHIDATLEKTSVALDATAPIATRSKCCILNSGPYIYYEFYTPALCLIKEAVFITNEAPYACIRACHH